eukprot:854559_1
MKYKVAIVFIIAVIATLLWGVGADTICNANHEKGSLSAFTPVPAYNITRTKCNKKKCTVYCSEHYHPAKHPNSYRKSVGALCKLTDDGVVTWDLVDTCVPKKCYANKENASLIAAAPAYNPTRRLCDEYSCTLFCGTGYRRSNDPDYRFVGASCERIDGQINWKFKATCIKTNIVIPKTLKFDSQGQFEDMFSEVFDGFAQKAKSADRDDEYDALDPKLISTTVEKVVKLNENLAVMMAGYHKFCKGTGSDCDGAEKQAGGVTMSMTILDKSGSANISIHGGKATVSIVGSGPQNTDEHVITAQLFSNLKGLTDDNAYHDDQPPTSNDETPQEAFARMKRQSSGYDQVSQVLSVDLMKRGTGEQSFTKTNATRKVCELTVLFIPFKSGINYEAKVKEFAGKKPVCRSYVLGKRKFELSEDV